MNLSTGEMALVFAACVLAICGIVVAWQRGLFAKVVGGNAPADAKPTTHTEATK